MQQPLDGPRDSRTKWSKSDRERQIPYDITYMRNLNMTQKKLPTNRNRLIDIENKLVIEKGEGYELKVWVSRRKLFYIEWISNRTCCLAQETIFQYPVINHNGKEYEKECMYHLTNICITEPFFCTLENRYIIVNQLYFNRLN